MTHRAEAETEKKSSSQRLHMDYRCRDIRLTYVCPLGCAYAFFLGGGRQANDTPDIPMVISIGLCQREEDLQLDSVLVLETTIKFNRVQAFYFFDLLYFSRLNLYIYD